MIGSGVLHQ